MSTFLHKRRSTSRAKKSLVLSNGRLLQGWHDFSDNDNDWDINFLGSKLSYVSSNCTIDSVKLEIVASIRPLKATIATRNQALLYWSCWSKSLLLLINTTICYRRIVQTCKKRKKKWTKKSGVSLFPFVIIPLEVVLESNVNYGGLTVIQPSVFDKTGP